MRNSSGRKSPKTVNREAQAHVGRKENVMNNKIAEGIRLNADLIERLAFTEFTADRLLTLVGLSDYEWKQVGRVDGDEHTGLLKMKDDLEAEANMTVYCHVDKGKDVDDKLYGKVADAVWIATGKALAKIRKNNA